MCYRHSLTCQRALCNGGKRQGDSQRVIDMDLVHGSSTTLTAVQNRVQLREKLLRTYEKLAANMRNYESLSTTMRTLYVKELRILEKTMETHDAQDDLGNISKVNETCNFIATYDNRLEKQTNPIPSPDSHNIYANIR